MRSTFLAAFFLCFGCLAESQSFHNPRRLPLSFNPSSVIAGDLNGDGIPDLVYGTDGPAGPALHSLLADGRGGYAPGFDVALPPGASTRCQLADLNGDRKLDLVCVSVSTEQLIVLSGRGDGSFGTARTTPLPGNGDSVLLVAAVTDLNRDGTPDVVVTTGGLQLYVLLNDGTGILSPAPVVAGTVYGAYVQVADLNGDGYPDLLVQAAGSLNTEVQFGHGDGTCTRGSEFGGNTGAVLADMDGDGHPDLVGGGDGILKVFHGNPDGTFATLPFSTADFTDGNPYDGTGFGTYLLPYAVHDVNGDGILDILGFGQNGLTVMLGEPGLKFGVPRSFAVSDGALPLPVNGSPLLLDMDGDGHVDLVSVGPNGIYISYGRADGSFQSADVYPSGLGVKNATLADVNEDGHPDVITSGDTQLYVSAGRADGTFGPATAIPSLLPLDGNANAVAYSQVLHGDVNGDGHQDLVVVGPTGIGTSGVYLLLGHGDGTFSTPARLAGDSDSSTLFAVLDLNHDGRSDIVERGSDESLTIFLAQIDGTFRVTHISSSLLHTEAQSLTFGDLNGDGVPELIFATGDHLTVLPGVGDGTFGPALTYAIPPLQAGLSQGATSFAVGDFDGDGAPDVAVLLTLSPAGSTLLSNVTQVVTFYRQGPRSVLDAGSFGAAVPGPVSQQSYAALRAADLDGDGKADLIAQGAYYLGYRDSIGTFLGQANRTFGPEMNFVADAALTPPEIADLNGDGRPDLVIGHTQGNAFTVLLSQGAPLATGTLTAAPNPVAAGAPFAITASVRVAGTTVGLSGTVTFAVDGTPAGMANFAGGAATITGPVTLLPGVHQLTAVTSTLADGGGTTYPSLNLAGQVTVGVLSTTVSLTADPNPALTGQQVTFSVATANGAGAPSGASLPTGTVIVRVNGTAVGVVTLAGTPQPGGAVAYSFSAPGSFSVTASYSGDASHAASTTGVTEVVDALPVASDFTLTLSAPQVTVLLGSEAGVVAQLGSLGGYAGSLQLAFGTLPPGLAAAFSPGQVTLSAAGQGRSTLQIAAGPLSASNVVAPSSTTKEWSRAVGAMAVCCLLPFGRRRRGLRASALAIAVGLVLIPLQGCGVAGIPLAASGTYLLTVTATDVATHTSHSAPLRVIVTTQLPPPARR